MGILTSLSFPPPLEVTVAVGTVWERFEILLLLFKAFKSWRVEERFAEVVIGEEEENVVIGEEGESGEPGERFKVFRMGEVCFEACDGVGEGGEVFVGEGGVLLFF